MFKLFKRKKNTSDKINLGNINLNPLEKKRRFVLQDKKLRVVKVNEKDTFYKINLDKSNLKVLNLSSFGRETVKKYPEVVSFLRKVFNKKFSRVVYKDNFFKERKNTFFENRKVKINLQRLSSATNINNDFILKMKIVFKDINQTKQFFVKVNTGYLNAEKEFLANQLFQKFGINTIKPHFAYTDKTSKKSIIVYDFTNLKTVGDAFSLKIITGEEYRDVYKKIEKLYDYKKIPLATYNRKGVGDFNNAYNIFVRKENNKVDVYFTDLFIEREGRAY